jgi:hypothetical protein
VKLIVQTERTRYQKKLGIERRMLSSSEYSDGLEVLCIVRLRKENIFCKTFKTIDPEISPLSEWRHMNSAALQRKL